MVELCPICKQKVPFGIQTHMLAAHGPNSEEYKHRYHQLNKENSAEAGKRSRTKGKRRKPPGKKRVRDPRLSKLS